MENTKNRVCDLSKAIELWWDERSLAMMLFDAMTDDCEEEAISVIVAEEIQDEPGETNLFKRAIKKPTTQKGLSGQGMMFGRKGNIQVF